MGFFEKLKSGLTKTRQNFTDRITELVGMSAKVDEDFLEELEMILLTADVGVKTTEKLIEDVRQAAKKREIKGTEDVLPFLKKQIAAMLKDDGVRTRIGARPTVILVVGVNGVGKTTTIGKLSNYFRLFNYKVMMAAGDTFRAAASAQLKIWGERAQCDVIAHEEGADPAAVVFDALKAAKARGTDVLFIDTAGRLHNKVNLMNELGKIDRIIKREIPEAPHEVFLVLDATTGQNAITQAKVFTETTKITGVVLTKLDGTAKGGVVVAIREELGLPVKWIGIGEGIMDFRPFEPEKFVDALMFAVIVNTITILIGASVGLLLRKGLPESVSDAMMKGLGLCTIFIGIQGMIEEEYILVLILSTIVGIVIGELLDVDGRINRAAERLTSRFSGKGEGAKIAQAFVTSCLIMNVGAMTIVGSLDAGLRGNFGMLYTKSLLDLISGIPMAAAMGVGVMGSALFTLVFQGGIVLLAEYIAPYLSETLIKELVSTGSLMILAIGFNMLGVTKLKVLNYLPGLLVVPLALKLMQALGF